MSKIKLLVVGDAGFKTGFEQVFRGVGTYLHNTGNYEVLGWGLGFNGTPEQVRRYDFSVWPAHIGGDYFSFERMVKFAQEQQVDAIWMVQDIWNHLQLGVQKPMEIPLIGYMPVDTPNIRWGYAQACATMAQPIAYTDFGANELCAGVRETTDLLFKGAAKKGLDLSAQRQWVSLPHPGTDLKLNLRMDYLARWQNLENWIVIPHGVDRTEFYPLDKQEARKHFGFTDDEFLVGNIGTNQFRKRLDITFRMFAMLAATNPKAKLVLYCSGNNDGGLELHQLAEYHGIHDRIYFMHDYMEEVGESDMNLLYNCLDIHINTSGGEGWGLNTAYSACAGVPQMVPDWSATGEIWKDHALLIPVLDWRTEHRQLNTCHAILDVKSGGQQLIEFSKSRDLQEKYSLLAAEKAATFLTWDQVGAKFDFVIRRTLSTFGEPTPLSLQQIKDFQSRPVESFLRNAVYLENGIPVKA